MKLLVVFLLATSLASAQSASTTLKDAYKGFFRIGVVVNPRQFEERDTAADRIIGADEMHRNDLRCIRHG